MKFLKRVCFLLLLSSQTLHASDDDFEKYSSALITNDEKVDFREKLDQIKGCKAEECDAFRAYFLGKLNDSGAKQALIKAFGFNEDEPLLSQGIHEPAVLVRLFLSGAFNELPLWLVLEEPSLLDYLGERHSPQIFTDYHINQLPAFQKLRAHMNSMEEGRWVTTSYMLHAGTIIYDINAANNHFLDCLSIYPQSVIFDEPMTVAAKGREEYKTSIKKHFMPLISWSYQGIWNRENYTKFEKLFDEAALELKNYYQNHARMAMYAPYADWVLSSYVNYCFSFTYDIAESPAFRVFHEPDRSLEALKEQTKEFSNKDWSEALSIAILNHYSPSIIAWIIQSGADVNAMLENESPLMKAVNQPQVLALLLKQGASVNQETPFGKTALFYAVQYNQLESVKLLVEAKADVNHKLKDLEAFKELDEYLLEKVAGFTPYVYSLRYASPQITEYLLERGANPQDISRDKYEEWVLARKTELN